MGLKRRERLRNNETEKWRDIEIERQKKNKKMERQND